MPSDGPTAFGFLFCCWIISFSQSQWFITQLSRLLQCLWDNLVSDPVPVKWLAGQGCNWVTPTNNKTRTVWILLGMRSRSLSCHWDYTLSPYIISIQILYMVSYYNFPIKFLPRPRLSVGTTMIVIWIYLLKVCIHLIDSVSHLWTRWRHLKWASDQISKIAGCACAGNDVDVFQTTEHQRKQLVSDPGMHHGTCVTHVLWCMLGALTRSDGENVPGACATRILRIWQEAYGRRKTAAVAISLYQIPYVIVDLLVSLTQYEGGLVCDYIVINPCWCNL